MFGIVAPPGIIFFPVFARFAPVFIAAFGSVGIGGIPGTAGIGRGTPGIC